MVMVTLVGTAKRCDASGNSTKVFGALHCSKYIYQGIYSLATSQGEGERKSKVEGDEENKSEREGDSERERERERGELESELVLCRVSSELSMSTKYGAGDVSTLG